MVGQRWRICFKTEWINKRIMFGPLGNEALKETHAKAEFSMDLDKRLHTLRRTFLLFYAVRKSVVLRW